MKHQFDPTGTLEESKEDFQACYYEALEATLMYENIHTPGFRDDLEGASWDLFSGSMGTKTSLFKTLEVFQCMKRKG